MSRRNALLNAAVDSYPTAAATSAMSRLVVRKAIAAVRNRQLVMYAIGASPRGRGSESVLVSLWSEMLNAERDGGGDVVIAGPPGDLDNAPPLVATAGGELFR